MEILKQLAILQMVFTILKLVYVIFPGELLLPTTVLVS